MTKIEWTEKTWNPIVGCSIVSPGCTNCYAMRMAARLEAMAVQRGAEILDGYDRPEPLSHYLGTTRPSKAGAVWTGKVALAREHILTEPLRRKRPTMWFVNSMSDLFHEDVPDAWIDRVFAVMALSPQHTFQVLTKRSARMRAYVNRDNSDEYVRTFETHWRGQESEWCKDGPHLSYLHPRAFPAWPLSNVWLGVSAERQQEADARIPDLLATPAAVRFVSAEPLLGPIDFTRRQAHRVGDRLSTRAWMDDLDWIIVGGESGPDARPMHPAWARLIRDQCKAAGVAFFFKQWGSWMEVYDRDRDDPDWRRCSQVETDTPRGQWLNLAGGQGFHGERVVRMIPTNKASAGRFLDGRTHDAMPAQRTESTPEAAA